MKKSKPKTVKKARLCKPKKHNFRIIKARRNMTIGYKACSKCGFAVPYYNEI